MKPTTTTLLDHFPNTENPTQPIINERFLLLTLAAVQFTHIMDFMVMMPLGPRLMETFHISPQQFSWLVAAYTLSAGICGFLGSFVLDKFERKTVLQILYLGFMIGTLGCAFANSFALLLLARIVAGMFGGMLSAVVMALVGDIIPPERRGTAMGIVMTGFSVAAVFGVPFGLFLANIFSWHAPFIAVVLLGLACQFLIFKYIPLLPRPANHTGSSFAVLTEIQNQPNQQRALLLTFFLITGQFAVVQFIAQYLEFNVKIPSAQIPLVYFFGGFATLFTSPIIGKLTDKYGKILIFRVFAIATALMILIVTNLFVTPLIVVLLLTTIFFIAVSGRGIPATTLILGTATPHLRSGFMGINSTVQQISTALGSLFSGIIVTMNAAGEYEHYEMVGYFAILTNIICLILIGYIRTPK